MKLDEYMKCFFGDPSKGEKKFNATIDNYGIRNKGHEMYLQRVNKLALNVFDDKRKCLKNSIVKNGPK